MASPARPRHVAIVAQSPATGHAGAMAELAETLLYGCAALGHEASIVHGRFGPDLNILLSTTLAREPLPPSPSRLIVYNLEQFDAQSCWFPDFVRELYRTRVVWDYSAKNLRNLRASGLAMQGSHVPLGYVPQLTRIEPATDQDIDVLFYGSLNRHRAGVLEELTRRGLRVVRAFNVYGRRRDALIARAKVVLNLHYYAAQIFEIVRVSYLLANRKAVVTEASDDTDIDADLRPGLEAVAYDRVADAAERLVRDEPARHALEKAGFDAFRRRPQAVPLAYALSRLPW